MEKHNKQDYPFVRLHEKLSVVVDAEDEKEAESTFADSHETAMTYSQPLGKLPLIHYSPIRPRELNINPDSPAVHINELSLPGKSRIGMSVPQDSSSSAKNSNPVGRDNSQKIVQGSRGTEEPANLEKQANVITSPLSPLSFLATAASPVPPMSPGPTSKPPFPPMPTGATPMSPLTWMPPGATPMSHEDTPMPLLGLLSPGTTTSAFSFLPPPLTSGTLPTSPLTPMSPGTMATTPLTPMSPGTVDTTPLIQSPCGARPFRPDMVRHPSTISEPSTRGSYDNISSASSVPDFHILKSAMKKSSEKSPTGKRKLSIFNSVLRRVSIHRKDSMSAGRIATFFVGVDDHGTSKKENATRDDNEGEEEKERTTPKGHHLEKKRSHGSQLRESLFLILSGLYGLIVVILGAVIPITEIFISKDVESAFEAFYVYLYVVSILFLGYVYAYLLRRNKLKTEFLTRKLSRSLSWTGRFAGKFVDKKGEKDAKGKLRKRMISLDVSNHHTGTFYLRLGVLGFGIGSMIHSGLNFGTHFSVSDSSCNAPLQAIKPMIHLLFTFFQLYFIFMNSKMCIHRYKKLARFGLMHMCATNICVWFLSIVVETLHVIHITHGKHDTHDSHGKGKDNSSLPAAAAYDASLPHKTRQSSGHEDVVSQIANTTAHIGRKLHAVLLSNGNNSEMIQVSHSCQWSDMMGKAVEAAGPYLYPCTIEFSLMCAGILYIMWKNVGKRPRRPRDSEIEDEDDDQRVHRMSVDCTSSSRGLFLGILLMVGTIISIIAFYMLNNREDLKTSGIILTHLSETAIYTMTLIALFMAAWKMKSLTFHNEREADLEDILILISYTGLLAFIIFSLVASILSPFSTISGLTILSNVTMLLQATGQTIFMLAGDRMSAANEMQERKKPGREFITFLLISNFAMWAINTFETQTPQHNPVQVQFYGPEAWAIFTHISVPLGIYYRFHSTVCFSNIWKNAWKKRKHI